MTSLPILQLVVFLVIALSAMIVKNARLTQWLLLLGLLASVGMGLTLMQAQETLPFVVAFGGHSNLLGIELLVDEFSVLFTLFLGSLGTVIQAYAMGFFKTLQAPLQPGPYSGLMALLFFAMFGVIYTNDLFNTYVLIEVLSLATVALISIVRKRRNFMAAFRYLMLSEMASLSILMGIALIYMVTGQLNMTLIYQAMPEAYAAYPINITLALGFMGIGLAIKTAIFPFHEWLPDAYTSAPAPSSALLSALVSKAYMLVLIKVIFRVFGEATIESLGAPFVMTFFAAVAMIVGSLFALGQKEFKRMLAYSSVAQVGYLLLALSLLSRVGLEAMFFYMVSHALIKGTLFMVAGSFSAYGFKRRIEGLSGVASVVPFTALVFSLSAFAMVGIPGTSGFVAKFNMAQALTVSARSGFIALIIISSVLNALYFFPVVIKTLIPSADTPQQTVNQVPRFMTLALSILALSILTLGIAPGLILPYIEAAVTAIGF